MQGDEEGAKGGEFAVATPHIDVTCADGVGDEAAPPFGILASMNDLNVAVWVVVEDLLDAAGVGAVLMDSGSRLVGLRVSEVFVAERSRARSEGMGRVGR